MQKAQELTSDELDFVCGGAGNEGGGGSDLSDWLKLIQKILHIPSKPGGPIR
ncbi:MAG: hypothetical protein ABI192_19330 [Bradyrhizobium sp.]